MCWLREIFWLSALNSFHITPHYISMSENTVADALSCLHDPSHCKRFLSHAYVLLESPTFPVMHLPLCLCRYSTCSGTKSQRWTKALQRTHICTVNSSNISFSVTRIPPFLPLLRLPPSALHSTSPLALCGILSKNTGKFKHSVLPQYSMHTASAARISKPLRRAIIQVPENFAHAWHNAHKQQGSFTKASYHTGHP